jgi:hypothetical protein
MDFNLENLALSADFIRTEIDGEFHYFICVVKDLSNFFKKVQNFTIIMNDKCCSENESDHKEKITLLEGDERLGDLKIKEAQNMVHDFEVALDKRFEAEAGYYPGYVISNCPKVHLGMITRS